MSYVFIGHLCLCEKRGTFIPCCYANRCSDLNKSKHDLKVEVAYDLAILSLGS